MHRWTIPFFALFLLAPAIAGLFGFGGEAIENRALARIPDWTRASWLDREQYKRLGEWFADALPLRPEAISLDSWIDYELLGDSPSPQVMRGRNGELFLTRSLSTDCPSPELDRVAMNAARLGRALGRNGTETYLLFSPNKAFLYPERLPPMAADWQACHADDRAKLRQWLREQRSFVAIDLWTLFEGQRDGGDRLFAKLNRHWDGYAGMLQAQSVIGAIQPGLWDPQAVKQYGTEEHPAELPHRFMNLTIAREEDSYVLERPGVESEITRGTLAADEERLFTLVNTRSDGPRLIPGRTVIVHDSFIFRSAAFLNGYFEQIHYLHWLHLTGHPSEAAELLHDADRVVFQLIEDGRGWKLGGEYMGVLAALREIDR